MAENTHCNVCSRPGTYDEAVDVSQVHSNVRKFRDKMFTVWRCINCGSLHSKEDVDLDWYYAHYFIHEQKLDYFTRRIHGRLIRKLLKFGIKKEQTILDFGCGNGVLIERLRELGFTRTVGYDPYVDRFANPETLSQQYDAIVSSEVIEHVPEPRDWMREVTASTKPGGLVVVTCPNASDIDLSQTQKACHFLHQPYHRHVLSENALRELGTSCGLQWLHLSRRTWDRVWPAVSERFFFEYVRATGGCIDVAVEPAKLATIFTSPRLVFFALYGYFFPLSVTMLNVFRKTGR